MPSTVQISELELLYQLLKRDKRNSAELARQADVGYFWLRKLRGGKTKAPSYEPTRKLLLFLCRPDETPKSRQQFVKESIGTF